ncbi:16S rRNA (uracil(1498)-N(3))-methyltransferase [Streptomyces calidiresistens]|uniref:Ribosomal RNA small subunit methyltransferase E n=1 Tax=Streptomyces calidiresistens TaxID=1485586 RepID=A0A7W3T0Q6_9ACTN|nr:16S rRNA (uracil(1498)-N(3))-methyltransferase [Streptomyces calidiresistens]MBB0228795.1 16S rRNA (uracil(1498)-N(3))-methyltransferase [Streptomyces calidiresistens]
MTAPLFVHGAVAGARTGEELWLEGPEGRHAVSVKRLRIGEELILADGLGHGVAGEVVAVEGRDRLRAVVTAVRREPVPEPPVTVVQALPKGDRGEVAVETLTETGVDTIVPWQAARCVTRWRAERGEKALTKWRNTAREAGKQSRRLRFPEVTGAHTTEGVAALIAGAIAAGGTALVLHESASVPLVRALDPTTGGPVVLVVGPEGGIAPEELTALGEAGARPVRLGPAVLRTSTAGTVAAAVVLSRTPRWA